MTLNQNQHLPRPPGSTREDEALPATLDLGLVAYLTNDPRPTVVCDGRLAAGSSSGRSKSPAAAVVYQNPAFAQLLAAQPKHDPRTYEALIVWATGPQQAGDGVEFCGQSWSYFEVGGRWRTIAATQVVYTSGLNGAPARKSSQTLANGTLDEPDSEHAGPTTAYIDWTSGLVPGISNFVKEFIARDWSLTPLGPISQWPLELRHACIDMMASLDPRVILWGRARSVLYNEASLPIIGNAHPQALGADPADAFPTAWDPLKPIVAAAEAGYTTQVPAIPLTMVTHGFEEECFFKITFQPICGQDGHVAGIMDYYTECTRSVVAERRLATVVHLGDDAATVQGMDGIWEPIRSALDKNVDDIPLALLYTAAVENAQEGQESESSIKCSLHSTVGIDAKDMPDHAEICLMSKDRSHDKLVQAFREAWSTQTTVLIQKLDDSLPSFLQRGIPGRTAGAPISQAVVIPIRSTTHGQSLGIVLIGISARRPFDEDYRMFIKFLGDRLEQVASFMQLPHKERIGHVNGEEAALRYGILSQQLLQRTQEAESREAKFARLYENAPVGMYLLRPDATPIWINKAYSTITGVEHDERLERELKTQIEDYIVADDTEYVERSWTDMMRTGEPMLIDYRIKRPWRATDTVTGASMEGTTWLRASAFPELDEEGHIQTVLGWVTDVSLQKWTESTQQKRLEDALEAKAQTERFIDTVSHEIRNPLSAILQSADGIFSLVSSLEASKDQFDQKRIVDDILTFSKLDSNLIVLCPELVKPGVLIDRVLHMFHAEMANADIQSSRAIDANDDVEWVLDGSRVLQILINLLSNAIKFTRDQPEGRRRIVVSSFASITSPLESTGGVQWAPTRAGKPPPTFGDDWGAGADAYLQFSVTDGGQGLTAEEMGLLFQRFSQANTKTYSQYGGSGLGLFISKELCELHGGQIGVSSKYDEGSVFAFYVKVRRFVPNPRNSLVRSGSDAFSTNAVYSNFARRSSLNNPDQQTLGSGINSSPMTTAADLRSSASGLHLLVVEDNHINQRVMVQQLRAAGCHVASARNGIEALQHIQRSSFATGPEATDQALPLSVVLMDVEMPQMDGLTCVRKIRDLQAQGLLRSHLPCAAITANARANQVNEALDAGMDIVVTKPFRISDLMPKMLALVEDANGATTLELRQQRQQQQDDEEQQTVPVLHDTFG